MRRYLCALLVVPAALAAAPAAFAAKDAYNSQGLRKGVTLQGVREHQAALHTIATANGGTRASGTAGYDASAEYVFNRLRAAGYSPRFQEFEFPFYRELATPEFARTSPDARTYATPDEFTTMTYSGSGDTTAPATHLTATGSSPGPGCETGDFAGFPDGNVALVQRGGCTFKIKANNAEAAGASAAVIYNNVDGPLNGTLGTPGQNIPVIGTLQSIGQDNAARLANGPVTLHVEAATESETRTTRNVIADTATGDADRTMVYGAHLDSVIQGPGINDNGSGTASILEIAEQFAARDIKPNNRVRFAWWGAEELSLLGSTYYVGQLSAAERAQHAANLNFDMVGSPNYVRFVYDGDNSKFPVGPGAAAGPNGSGLIEAVFVQYFKNQRLASEATPFSGRSDYGPFIAQGIPAGGLFTGAEGIKTAAQAQTYGGTAGTAYDPCYHQACDTFANNSDNGLDEMSDAAAHAAYTFALTRAEIENGAVLKPGTQTPDGNNDGTGTPSGGGLHDDHDHAVASRAGVRRRATAKRKAGKRRALLYRGPQAVR